MKTRRSKRVDCGWRFDRCTCPRWMVCASSFNPGACRIFRGKFLAAEKREILQRDGRRASLWGCMGGLKLTPGVPIGHAEEKSRQFDLTWTILLAPGGRHGLSVQDPPPKLFHLRECCLPAAALPLRTHRHPAAQDRLSCRLFSFLRHRGAVIACAELAVGALAARRVCPRRRS